MINTNIFIKVSLLAAALLALAACAPQNTTKNHQITDNEAQSIIGGSDVEIDDDVAKITVSLVNYKTSTLCTGSIIDSYRILTAAHCVDKDWANTIIHFGLFAATPSHTRKAVDARIHENYISDVRARNTSDIAILYFEGGLPPGYKAARLLPNFDLLKNKTEIQAAGYGVSKSIQAPGSSAGSGKLRKIKLNIDDSKFSHTEISLKQSFRRGICSGDSGGPAYLAVNNQLYLWGVASRGAGLPFAACMFASVYTRIDSHIDWINLDK